MSASETPSFCIITMNKRLNTSINLTSYSCTSPYTVECKLKQCNSREQ